MSNRILLSSLLMLTVACSPWREVDRPWSTDSLNGWRTARATMADGSVVTLGEAVVRQQGDELLLCGTPTDGVGATSVSLRDAQRLERGQPGVGEFLLEQSLWLTVALVVTTVARL
jgi:hypothetical protein